MANRLKMAIVRSMLTLATRGWSQRRIARELGVSRTTVRGYLAAAGADSTCTTNPPPGWQDDSNWSSNPPPGSNRPPGSAGSGRGPASSCEPHRQVIEVKLASGLSGVRIWQDLVAEHGYARGYDSVKRYLRRLRATTPLPFRRLEVEPGVEAQVDFGTGLPIVSSAGRRRKTHVFRIVLSHSRKGYSENVFGQTTDAFLQALENAFWHVGGVPRTVVVDNLKAAVKSPDWFDPELNPKVQSFCEHYGTVMLPTKPYTPRHKGKIERGIGYVQDNALKGRRFPTLAKSNEHLLRWETGVADTRIHGTMRRQVGKVFEEIERPALLPLPAGRFPSFREAPRSVHRDGHVEVAKAYYSGPTGVCRPLRVGAMGRAAGAGVQSADGVDRDARPAGSGPTQHAERAHPRPEVLEGRTGRRDIAARGVLDRPVGRPMGQGDARRTRRGRAAGADRPAVPDPSLRRRRDRPGVRAGVGAPSLPASADPGTAEARRRDGTPGAVRVSRRTRDHSRHGSVRRRGSPGHVRTVGRSAKSVEPR